MATPAAVYTTALFSDAHLDIRSQVEGASGNVSCETVRSAETWLVGGISEKRNRRLSDLISLGAAE